MILKKVKSIFVLSIVVSILGCKTTYFKNPKAVYKTDYDYIKSDLQQYLNLISEKRKIIGGMSIGIKLSDGPAIAVSAGFENVEKQKVYSEHTPVLVAGITKVFTAVMILQLIEEGKLSLDDTLDVWLKDQPNAKQITIRMLLSHTSGIKDYLKNPNLRLQREYKPIELIQYANDLGFNELNKGFYTTTNHIILGLILEKVTGHSWVDELHTRIINPLNLTQTYYGGEDGIMENILAPNYSKEGKDLNVAENIHPSIGWAAGGIVSNVSDLFIFYETFLEGKLFHSQSILVQAMTPIVKAESDTSIHKFASFSLCLHQYNLKDMILLGHYGSFGYHSHILYDPDLKLMYVDTSNSMNSEEGFEDVINVIKYLRKLK